MGVAHGSAEPAPWPSMRSGNASKNSVGFLGFDHPLMPARHALSIRIAYFGHATSQKQLVAALHLEGFCGGHAVKDLDPRLFLACRALVFPGCHRR